MFRQIARSKRRRIASSAIPTKFVIFFIRCASFDYPKIESNFISLVLGSQRVFFYSSLFTYHLQSSKTMRYRTPKKRQFESSLLVLFLIFLLSIQSCHKSSVEFSKSIHPPEYLIHKYSGYPRWFWQMPHSKNAVFAVGYAQTYFYRDASSEKATENGIRSLARSVSIRIKGARGFEDTIYGSEYRGEDFQEELPEGVLDFVKKNHKVVATETVGNITLVLLGIGDIPPVSSKGFNPIPPSWVLRPPQRAGFLYAVGQCSPQYHEENAWQFAEYDARINLALSLFAQLRSLAKKLDRKLKIITTVKTDAILNRMQVDKRWVDPENEILYVLVRTRLKDNTESFMNQLRKIVPPQPHRKDKQNIEEIIQKAFEELDEVD